MAQDLVAQEQRTPAVIAGLSDEDREALRQAVVALERPSLVARLANIVGRGRIVRPAGGFNSPPASAWRTAGTVQATLQIPSSAILELWLAQSGRKAA